MNVDPNNNSNQSVSSNDNIPPKETNWKNYAVRLLKTSLFIPVIPIAVGAWWFGAALKTGKRVFQVLTGEVPKKSLEKEIYDSKFSKPLKFFFDIVAPPSSKIAAVPSQPSSKSPYKITIIDLADSENLQSLNEKGGLAITKPNSDPYDTARPVLMPLRASCLQSNFTDVAMVEDEAINGAIEYVGDLLPKEKIDGEPIKDSSNIYITTKELKFGIPGDQKTCLVEIATLKGNSDKGLKMVSEDASIAETLSVTIGNTVHTIAFMATMDGGGGHHLGQYAEKNLKVSLEKNLNDAINQENDSASISLPELLLKAIDATKNQLFDHEHNNATNPSNGEGWKKIVNDSQDFETRTGVPVGEFKSTLAAGFLDENGKQVSLMDIFNAPRDYDISKLTLQRKELLTPVKLEGTIFTIGEFTCDLSKVNELESLKDELINVSSSGASKIQMAISTVFVDNGLPKCLTVNYGDTSAISEANGVFQALSKETMDATSCNTAETPPSCTLINLNENTLVCQFTDGITDFMDFEEMKIIMNQEEYKELNQNDQAVSLIKLASLKGFDDKTFASLRITN